MKKQPRYYQAEAVQAAIDHIREAMPKKKMSASIIDAAPGTGKSLMIAMVAEHVSSRGGHVLCLSNQPVLCEQNYDEAWEWGLTPAMYAAKFRKKQVNDRVVYATTGTLVRSLTTDFADRRFDLILIDECHQTPYDKTDSDYMKIINHFRWNSERLGSKRPLQVIGLTGSPYRNTDSIIGSFWDKVVYNIGIEKATDEGFLSRPIYGFADEKESELNFSGVETIKNSWDFDEKALNEIVMSGDGKRRLVNIMKEVVLKTKDRNQVIIFASTKRHAAEVRSVLVALGEDVDMIGLVTDDTTQKDRDAAIERSKAGDLHWLINVSCLTTGFDSPLIDVVLFLRPVGSLTLLVQCLGRGARLLKDSQVNEGYVKPNYLVLDYAGVFDRLGHLLDNPIINEAELEKSRKEKTIIHCPHCKAENSDSARRCISKVHALHPDHNNERNLDGRCSHFWTSNPCPKCQTQNDITAQVCRNKKCGFELMDPNRKLLGSAYSEDELVEVVRMEVTESRGGSIQIEYFLKNPSDRHGNPIERFFAVTGKGKRAFDSGWLAVHVPNYGWRKKITQCGTVQKILGFHGSFKAPTKIAYRINDKGGFTVGRKMF